MLGAISQLFFQGPLPGGPTEDFPAWRPCIDLPCWRPWIADWRPWIADWRLQVLDIWRAEALETRRIGALEESRPGGLGDRSHGVQQAWRSKGMEDQILETPKDMITAGPYC